ncbi:hypothetical protein FHX40_0033 [Thermopolyspora flexuosa]|jgi:hypothetical protein|uniref:Uncharacterized protein n=1 Tax=Thermopolyspora flexuosa TaxID=103836 RepID=A0A543IS45_9ACTN|nr:hypothetical protein FHX40_0033 [Thermopolyspora flexuosa]
MTVRPPDQGRRPYGTGRAWEGIRRPPDTRPAPAPPRPWWPGTGEAPGRDPGKGSGPADGAER